MVTNSQFFGIVLVPTIGRHSQMRKDDHDPSIFTCAAHTIDVRQYIIPSATKSENVRID